MPERFAGHHLPGILYAFPAETVIAAGQIFTAVTVAFNPAAGLYYIPAGVARTMFCGLLFLAGMLTLVGLAGYRRDWQAGIEQLGLWLGAAATLCYAILILINPGSQAMFATTVFFAVAVSSALRAHAIRILHQARLHELQVANELREESARHAGRHQ